MGDLGGRHSGALETALQRAEGIARMAGEQPVGASSPYGIELDPLNRLSRPDLPVLRVVEKVCLEDLHLDRNGQAVRGATGATTGSTEPSTSCGRRGPATAMQTGSSTSMACRPSCAGR